MKKDILERLLKEASSDIFQKTGSRGGIKQSCQIRISTTNTPDSDIGNVFATTNKIIKMLKRSGLKYNIGAQYKDWERIADKKIKQLEKELDSVKYEKTKIRIQGLIDHLRTKSGLCEDEILIYITI